MYDNWELLIGRHIEAVAVTEGEHELVFQTTTGTVIATTEGDCCSETWFADVTGVQNLIGHTVAVGESVKLPGYNVEDGRTRAECDEVYGARLTTEAGYADIVYRNSSNGYYGGNAALAAATTSNVPLAPTRPITEDWSA